MGWKDVNEEEGGWQHCAWVLSPAAKAAPVGKRRRVWFPPETMAVGGVCGSGVVEEQGVGVGVSLWCVRESWPALFEPKE